MVARTELEAAVKKRKDQFISEKETLSVKNVRRLLEQDLGLKKKALDEHKDLVGELLDQHVLADPAWAEAVQPPKAASGKKRSAAAVQDEDTLRKAVKKAKPAAVKPAKPASKPSTKRQAVAESKGEEEDSDGGSEGGEEERTKPRAKAAGKGSQSAATADPKVKKLQAVCRAAGIKIPPSIYVKNKDPLSLRSALSSLLGEYGLSADAGERAIAKVHQELERKRELEGMDLANIIDEDGGRGSRRRAAARVDYKSIMKPKEFEEIAGSDEEEEEDDDQEDSESADEDSALASPDDEGKHSAGRRGKGAAGGKQRRKQQRAAASSGSEEQPPTVVLDDDSDDEAQQPAAAQKVKFKPRAADDVPNTDDEDIRESQEEEELQEELQQESDEEVESDFEDVEDDDQDVAFS